MLSAEHKKTKIKRKLFNSGLSVTTLFYSSSEIESLTQGFSNFVFEKVKKIKSRKIHNQIRNFSFFPAIFT